MLKKILAIFKTEEPKKFVPKLYINMQRNIPTNTILFEQIKGARLEL